MTIIFIGVIMAQVDRFLKRDKINLTSLDNIDENIMLNIRKGRLIGVARSIIIDYIESFNQFNELNEFRLKLGTPDIRHYDGDNVYCPDDMRFVATLSEKKNTTNFIQVFFPYYSIYIVLDHILGGYGDGEYDREFSFVEKTIVDYYFNFYNEYKTATHSLYYESNVEMSTVYPIKPLFSGLNIIVAYIPLLLKNKPFTEILIRINLDVLNDIVEASRETPYDENIDNRKDKLFSIRKMSTDEELDNIVKNIIETKTS
jgi:hypothetical protein